MNTPFKIKDEPNTKITILFDKRPDAYQMLLFIVMETSAF